MEKIKPIICLIIPPSPFLLDERVFVSLGILKVAAVLEENGYPIELIDMSGIQNYPEVMEEHCRNTNAKIFGITTTTPQLPSTMNIKSVIRNIVPDAKIILGGPHITLINAAYRLETRGNRIGRATLAFLELEKQFDVLVAGDGEESIFQAIDPDSPKLIDADDPTSNLFLDNARLNKMPLPARHLVDLDSYHYMINNVKATSLIAQLGCPFNCGFCGGRESPSLRRVRLRSVENIIQEIISIHDQYDISGFMMYDDELNVNPGMLNLMQAIINVQEDLKKKFVFRGFIKAQLFTDKQAEMMFQAGFRWILVGFESGSPRILKNINKKSTVEENTRCVEIARRNGLKVKALMSIGHPGESHETIAQTREWLLSSKPDDFDISIITVYPGSPYYDKAVAHENQKDIWVYTYNNDRLYCIDVDYTKVADYYKGDPDGGYRAFVYTDYLTSVELVKLRNDTESEVRKLLKIPFNPAVHSVRYEHSMGQTDGSLPTKILKRSVNNTKNQAWKK